MMRRYVIAIIAMLAALCAAAGNAWLPDSLGDGYQMRYVDQGSDYSGRVRSTIIRKLAPGRARTAILYVHGFNDYFFQTNLGDFFVNRGVDFYAVDLRKYGRSLMAGQRRFEVRSLQEYFPDIDSALAQIRADGVPNVVMMGHSTGGLITTYYLSYHQPPQVKGLILNSPFLDWNMSPLVEKVGVPIVASLARIAPRLKIPQGGSTAYSESLLRGKHGRWNYDTAKKLVKSPAVDPAWIKAIDQAQERVQRGDVVKIPILLMHSDNTVSGSEWTEAFNHGDAVLDVKDIQKYGRRLGPSVTDVTVHGGLHDLVLSQPRVEAAVLQSMWRFIQRLGLAPAPKPQLTHDKE